VSSSQGAFAALARSGGRGALVTVLAGGAPGAKLFVGADGSTEGSLGSPGVEAVAIELAGELMWSERSERRDVGELSLFVDVTFPAPRLIAFGAVDLAGALCRIDCVVQELHPGGDHVIVLGRIVGVDRRVGAPLLFHGGRFGLLEVDASSPAMDLWDSLSTGWF